MKQYMKLITLLLLISSTLFTKSSKAQEKKCLTVSEYAQWILDLAEGTKAIEDLKQDSIVIAKYQKEVERKEGVIQKIMDQRNTCYDNVKVLQADIDSKAALINAQRSTIEKLEKKARPKRFGIGPTVGYGYSTARPGVFAGIALSYSLIRF